MAAVTTALDYPDDPGVLEVTLKIGSSAGAWAKVFGRREKLTTERTAAILAIWRKAMGRLSLKAAIARWWRTASLSAADGQRTATRADATQAATGWLRGIVDTDEYPELQAELTDALTAAMAEGKPARSRSLLSRPEPKAQATTSTPHTRTTTASSRICRTCR